MYATYLSIYYIFFSLCCTCCVISWGHLFLTSSGQWLCRSDHELRMESWEYISKRRVALHDQGFRITSVISSQMDALTGPCLGKQNFKFSNPTYYQIAQSITGFWYMLYQCSMSLFMVYNIQLMQFLQFFVYMVICLNE